MFNISDFLLGWCCAYLSLLVMAAYIGLRDILWRLVKAMDVDELIKTIASDEATPQQQPPVDTTDEISQKREKLATVVAGGQAGRYLGRAISLDQIDKLSNAKVAKLYARYEMCLGASMAQTIGRSILSMHSDLVARYEPELDTSSLAAELEADPLVEHGLSSITCRLFYTLSWYLAPLSAALITFKHIRRAQVHRHTLEDGRDRNDGEKSGDRDEGEKPEESKGRPSVGCGPKG